jgi:hypothetical protein
LVSSEKAYAKALSPSPKAHITDSQRSDDGLSRTSFFDGFIVVEFDGRGGYKLNIDVF